MRWDLWNRTDSVLGHTGPGPRGADPDRSHLAEGTDFVIRDRDIDLDVVGRIDCYLLVMRSHTYWRTCNTLAGRRILPVGRAGSRRVQVLRSLPGLDRTGLVVVRRIHPGLGHIVARPDRTGPDFDLDHIDLDHDRIGLDLGLDRTGLAGPGCSLLGCIDRSLTLWLCGVVMWKSVGEVEEARCAEEGLIVG